jgi:hypothetical protein
LEVFKIRWNSIRGKYSEAKPAATVASS